MKRQFSWSVVFVSLAFFGFSCVVYGAGPNSCKVKAVVTVQTTSN
jgi:hypothetical protein